MENLPFVIWFSAQASTLGVFKHASGLGSTNLQIFRLKFPTKRLWASLIRSKTARYRLFLVVVRCCVTTTLTAETFRLLSDYLNYKFGLGMPSFHLFFSLFRFFYNWLYFLFVRVKFLVRKSFDRPAFLRHLRPPSSSRHRFKLWNWKLSRRGNPYRNYFIFLKMYL